MVLLVLVIWETFMFNKFKKTSALSSVVFLIRIQNNQKKLLKNITLVILKPALIFRSRFKMEITLEKLAVT